MRLDNKLPVSLKVVPNKSLFQDVRSLIERGRECVARTVNTGLVVLHWQIGKRIQTEIYKDKRADYGERILQTLSAKLVPGYGRGFSARNLASMVKFAGTFTDRKILQTLSAKLNWSCARHGQQRVGEVAEKKATKSDHSPERRE